MEPNFRCQTVVAKRPDSIWGGRPEVKCPLCHEWTLEDELQKFKAPGLPALLVCVECHWVGTIALARAH